MQYMGIVKILVVTAVLLLTTMIVVSDKAEASEYSPQPYIGLGSTVFNSKMTFQEVGVRFKEKYGFAVEATGVGQAKGESVKEVLPLYSLYRVIDPRWCKGDVCFTSSIGMAYTPRQSLIGNVNFRLEFILKIHNRAEIFIKHYSSAGTFRPNTGLDIIGVRLLLD